MEFSAENISTVLNRSLEQTSSLSTEDIVKVLLNHVNANVALVKNNVDERFSEERTHLNDVVQVITTSLSKKLDRFEDVINQNKLALGSIVSNIDLKFETVSSYQEQLINRINLKIQDMLISSQRQHVESYSTIEFRKTAVILILHMIFLKKTHHLHRKAAVV